MMCRALHTYTTNTYTEYENNSNQQGIHKGWSARIIDANRDTEWDVTVYT